jgi:hypothetical protein
VEMSKYMMLLYANEARMPRPGTPEFDAQNAAYGAVYENLSNRGVFVSGEPLGPSASATSVQVRDGQPSTASGPAATGPEQLIGYYVLECQSDAEAADLAATIPCAAVGTVEVRPVAQM